MKLKLFYDKSVEKNATIYYEKAKYAKKKIEGVKEIIARTKKELDELQKQKDNEIEKIFIEKQKLMEKKEVKKEWYEKFHWFFSSEGFLCIGGRDATSNEIVVKKHAEEGDLIFHTDMAGSPFFIVKNGKKTGENTIKEAAQATASYSKAWKLQLSYVDVFYVNPDQVTKEAKAGEYVAKGAFMIYGKKNYLTAKLEVAVGVVDKKVIGGPVAAIEVKSKKFIKVVPGNEKNTDIAKQIKKQIGGDLDSIIRFLPAGGCKIVK
ncbi:MAG: NFACT RNA binding domain-containing protein [Candidatus Woesearchaeota archaeon]